MIKTLIKSLIKSYQYCISSIIPPCCKFQPTCSTYFLHALEIHPINKAITLSIKRLTRCHPFSSKHGYDPVPQPVTKK